MNKQITTIFCAMLVVALVAAMQLQNVEAGVVGNALTKFFDDRRVTKCPVPGEESEYVGKITIKVANFPKEPCMEHCGSKQLDSIVGSEQISFGPKLICCCKARAD